MHRHRLERQVARVKLHLTPEILRAAYEYLRACPPFNRWKLPQADEVEFHVTRHTDRRGDCEATVDGHCVRISAALIGRTSSLMETLAHEMIHVRLDRKGVRSHHGRDFQRCAAQVCRYHGFDLKLF